MDDKIINNIRGLSIDMIDVAQSGHPGICLGATPILYTLYKKIMNYDISKPDWINRDRFVMSAGHGSALLYAMLYYLDYLTLEELKTFRQLGSICPGHPEIITKGVDVSTGPLGSGLASAIGLAIGERYQAKYFGENIISHYTYCLVGDGDLEEGISYEAMNIAGRLKLNKLIVLYDSNDITLDNVKSTSSCENMELRCKASGWNYLFVKDGEDIQSIEEKIRLAQTSDLPTLIEIKTIIGRYSLKQGTCKVHGSPLTKEDITQLKEKLDLWDSPFAVSQDSIIAFRYNLPNNLYNEWKLEVAKLPENLQKDLNKLVDRDYTFDFNIETLDVPESPREFIGRILDHIAQNEYMIIGGSADLSSSTKTIINNGGIMSSENYLGRNIYYGIREHAMGCISNGISLSGLLPFCSTFFTFTDYMRSSIRLSCLMNLFNIFIMTHDSITVGEDGPTHQPIEHLESFRNMPNIDIYRPNDINEAIASFKLIKERKKTSLILGARNKTSIKNNNNVRNAMLGAYIFASNCEKADITLISSGEELDIALEVYNDLVSKAYNIKLVSMLSMNIFEEQSSDYKESIIDPTSDIYVLELSTARSYYKYTTEDKIFCIKEFGMSGKYLDILDKFNLTAKKIIEIIEKNNNL